MSFVAGGRAVIRNAYPRVTVSASTAAGTVSCAVALLGTYWRPLPFRQPVVMAEAPVHDEKSSQTVDEYESHDGQEAVRVMAPVATEMVDPAVGVIDVNVPPRR